MSIAQIWRAILLASAIATNIFGLRKLGATVRPNQMHEFRYIMKTAFFYSLAIMLSHNNLLPSAKRKGYLNLRTLFAVIAVTLVPHFAVGQSVLSGKTMADTCAGCHGTDGVPAVSYIPPLAGLSVESFTKAMNGYRDGTRRATIMNRVAPAFSDAEIAAMADYFAALPKPVLADSIRNRPEN